MAALISINGVDLPDPSSFQLALQDIDAATTTRSANGTMCRDRVVGGASSKRKIELEWKGITMKTSKTILTAIKDEFFTVTYPDAYEGAYRTATFYAGDRTLPMFGSNLPGKGVVWEKLAVNLIEK